MKIKSDGKKWVDPTMYTGTGGNSLFYYRLMTFCDKMVKFEKFVEMRENWENDFETSLNTNLALYSKMEKDSTCSFLMSEVGLFVLKDLFWSF